MERKIQSQINRLKVFSTVKRLMEETGECPTATMVAELCGMHQTVAARHMDCLSNADGLPFPISKGTDRVAENNILRRAERGCPINLCGGTEDVTHFFQRHGAV